MAAEETFVDIHCHLAPGIDDGAKDWDDCLAMAKIAVEDGISTIVLTPHQLGNFAHNSGDAIRKLTAEVQRFLKQNRVPLTVLPGGDVRIEPGMVAKIKRGEVLSLADRRKHVLLELPHELYMPLEPLLDELHGSRMVGILSHPERNLGILTQPEVIGPLVDAGCLMQVTAGSVVGAFGPRVQALSEWLLEQGLVHFISTDAHGTRSRRPTIQRAFDRVAELTDWDTALDLCCYNPASVTRGEEVQAGRMRRKSRGWASWFGWKRAS